MPKVEFLDPQLLETTAQILVYELSSKHQLYERLSAMDGVAHMRITTHDHHLASRVMHVLCIPSVGVTAGSSASYPQKKQTPDLIAGNLHAEVIGG